MQETRILALHTNCCSIHILDIIDYGKQKRANLDQASALEIRAFLMSVHSNSNLFRTLGPAEASLGFIFAAYHFDTSFDERHSSSRAPESSSTVL